MRRKHRRKHTPRLNSARPRRSLIRKVQQKIQRRRWSFPFFNEESVPADATQAN